jgi:predicted membrane chloride channel (bestrophin family)
MQKSSKSEVRSDSLSRPLLLGLVSAIVIGVVAPLLLPHITHPSMIYHIAVHIAGLVISIFLVAVSIIAYDRIRSGRLLFMALAFVTLALVEFLYLLDASGRLVLFDFSALGIEVPHAILLVMTTMFGLGVLKVNK